MPNHETLHSLSPRIERGGQGRLTGGSFCSGTDCGVLVWEEVLRTVERTGGIPGDTHLQFQHAFSCESDVKKQHFLQSFFPNIQLLFADALEVEHGRGLDVKSGQVQEAPAVGWVAAGFPCLDASSYNPRAASPHNRLCVAEARPGGVHKLEQIWIVRYAALDS